MAKKKTAKKIAKQKAKREAGSGIETFKNLSDVPGFKKPVAPPEIGMVKYVCESCGKTIEIIKGANATCSCGGKMKEAVNG